MPTKDSLLQLGVCMIQVELVCLLCQCMVDAARWEDGLKACESAMGVLPPAAHLPLSKWKVSQ